MREGALRDPYRLVGKTMGRYRMQRLVGIGGLGAVYQAEHLSVGATVAVKVLRPDVAAAAPETVGLFLREVEAIATLRHPSLATIVDCGATADDGAGGTAFVAMEWVEGHTLDDELRRLGSLPLDRVTFLLEEICEALAYIHSKGVVHRDIKPANVMMGPNRDGAEGVKLVDFGISKLNTSAAAAAGVVVGTPYYMSPEALAGAEVDHRADIYSLGVMIYEMIAGELPFGAASAADLISQHLSAPPKPLCQLRPDTPKAVEGVINTALAKRPQARYASAAELARAFRLAAGVSGSAYRQLSADAATGGGAEGPMRPLGYTHAGAAFDRTFDIEVGRIASLPTEEVRSELRRLGIEPTRELPPYLRHLRAARELQPAACSAGRNTVEALPSISFIARSVAAGRRMLLPISLLIVLVFLIAPFVIFVPTPSHNVGEIYTPENQRVPQTLRIWMDSSGSINERELAQSVSALVKGLRGNHRLLDGVAVVRFGGGSSVWTQPAKLFSWGAPPAADGNGGAGKGPSLPLVRQAEEARRVEEHRKALTKYEMVADAQITHLQSYLMERQQTPRHAPCTPFESLGERIAAEGVPLNLILTDGRLDCSTGETPATAPASGGKLLIVLLAASTSDTDNDYLRRERRLKGRFPNAEVIPSPMSEHISDMLVGRNFHAAPK